MNRITDKILHGMLILMIGLSFYLTYLIWVSPASHETSLEESLGNNRTEETSLKTKEEVFLPLKLRYQKEDTNQETQNEALLKAIQKENITTSGIYIPESSNKERPFMYEVVCV